MRDQTLGDQNCLLRRTKKQEGGGNSEVEGREKRMKQGKGKSKEWCKVGVKVEDEAR